MQKDKIIYEGIFRVNLGKAVPSIGGLADDINNHLATAGYDEHKIKITSDLPFEVYKIGARRLPNLFGR